MKSHIKEFVVILLGLAETYNRTLSEASISIYYEALKPYDFADVNRALNTLVRQNKFMPTIAEIVEIVEDKHPPDVLAEQAYNKLVSARREIGAYQSIVFDDPIIHRIIDQHGGWPAVCAMTKDDEQYTAFKKNFIQEYKAFMQDKNYSYPPKLAGLHEISNNAMAFDNYIPPPAIFGNKNKALEWINKQSGQIQTDKTDKKVIESVDKLAEKMSGKNGY